MKNEDGNGHGLGRCFSFFNEEVFFRFQEKKLSEFKHPNSIGPTTALRKQEGGGNNIITSQPDHFINDSYFIVIVNIGSNKLRIYAGANV